MAQVEYPAAMQEVIFLKTVDKLEDIALLSSYNMPTDSEPHRIRVIDAYHNILSPLASWSRGFLHAPSSVSFPFIAC